MSYKFATLLIYTVTGQPNLLVITRLIVCRHGSAPVEGDDAVMVTMIQFRWLECFPS